MSPLDRVSLRLVVQRIYENSSRQSSYRLVSYSNDRTYQPQRFETVDDVLKALKAVLPEVDTNLFYRGSREATSIVFANEVELNKEQLSVLGLKE